MFRNHHHTCQVLLSAPTSLVIRTSIDIMPLQVDKQVRRKKDRSISIHMSN